MHDTKQLQSLDMAHVLHPWADLATMAETPSMVIAEAEGYRVTDSDGRSYLDAIGGMWCMTVGYGNEELADAMAQQARRMAYYMPFGPMTSAPATELAAKLAELAPGDLNRVHFTTCGSTAVESALRFAHFYFACTGRPEKTHILSRGDAYHGSTYLTASVSGRRWDRTYFRYESGFVHLLSSPNPYRRPTDMSVEAFCDQKVRELEDKILELGPERVACFIAEPILAAGGVIVPPEGYQRRTWEICRKYDVLYISDEVVTGFGRIGHFFASEARFDIVPDIIVTAKGLTSGYQPLGAMIISEERVREISGDNAPENSAYTNGFTFSGHPVACAVALKNIEVMERDDICGHVREIGPYFMERLGELRRHPIVGDVRGDHLMACVECRVTKEPAPEPVERDMAVAWRVDLHCQDLGLLVRPSESLCILSPALIIDKQGVDEIVDILSRALTLTERDLDQEA